VKHIIRKAYVDYEKEENWLNEMAAKGLALINYSFCKYTFEDSEKGEYIYRIELLKELPSHPESVKYLRFLEETGIEYVASSMRWVYLRKKSSDGEFELYTDTDSKINHYENISKFWVILAIAEFLIGMSNISIGLRNIQQYDGFGFHYTNLIMGVIVILVGFFLLSLNRSLRKKIKVLKEEKF
jgi:Protein of unknown function (DUF2812)